MPVKENTWQKWRWVLPPVVAAILSLGIGWSSGVTRDITDLKLADAHYDGDLAVLNSKVDLLLKAFDVSYNGPAFHAHNQSKQ